MCRNYPAKAPRILKAVRKMVTLTATSHKDYCSGAARKKDASGQGKKLSTIDCVGYSVANRLKIPFLTGDREFADMGNVQFVR